ncbi:hypothetical protein BX600DRAFT_382529 [Xylariales sp. PMI_506]|nr:hypothetical protein BX600DRAFT_382529 [Xylariales sp. PMI_506]
MEGIQAEFKDVAKDFREKASQAGLTPGELKDFECSTFQSVEVVIASIQQKQLQTRKLQYIRRIEPFLKAMVEYGKVLDIFVNTSEILAFVWVASTLPEAFESLLKTYELLAEDMPLLSSYSDLFSQNPPMRLLLVEIYRDIMEFQLHALRYFRQKLWKQLFQAAWRGFGATILLIKNRLQRKKKLIESRIAIVQYGEIRKILEETQNISRTAEAELEERKTKFTLEKKQAVNSWLSPPLMESIHERHLKAREQDPESGRWLLDKPIFRKWFNPTGCITSVLWLNGKPGAGKTVLASLVIEKARKLEDVSVAFCYCAHGDAQRDNFLSIARTLLSQLLAAAQNDSLLDLLYEKMSTSGDTFLSRTVLAKELLEIALGTRKSYIILDGIDECARDERKEICRWFRVLADKHRYEVRCLFVSQDDGIGSKDLSMIPCLSITTQDNMNDIKTYCGIWQRQIEERFGPLKESGLNIADLVPARSNGMFIFARCVLEELYQQPSRKALLEEWSGNMFPNELEQVYEKILRRVMGSAVANRQQVILQVLSWISCSMRLLMWNEIQGLASINLVEQNINDENHRLVDGPKGLFGSLVDIQPNQTVDFVHSTVRTFLTRKEVVKASVTNRDMCLLCIRYLSFPSMQVGLDCQLIRDKLLRGQHSFYEYAVACWVPHLLSWISLANPNVEDITEMGESIDVFLSLHYVEDGTRQIVSKSMHGKLQHFQGLDQYDSLTQAIVWSRKQLTLDSVNNKSIDLLDFPQLTKEWRSVLEELVNNIDLPQHKAMLDRFYGPKPFRCPHVYCQYFYLGFGNQQDRAKHVDRHERAYTCTLEGCPRKTFGYAKKKDLDDHYQVDHGIFNDASEFPNIRKHAIEADNEDRTAGKYKCTYCPRAFTQSFNLNSHLVTHTRERAFICKTCQKAFGRKHDLKRHQIIHLRDRAPSENGHT